MNISRILVLIYMFRPIRALCPFANMPVRFAKFIARIANWFQFANGKKFLQTH